VLGDGDTVAVHCTWNATHTGEFMGIPATQKRIAQQQIHVLRLEDGFIAEHWAVRDDLGMLRQMGIAPG
jgi:predicted ester cyclase